jgi:hypothetical protein
MLHAGLDLSRRKVDVCLIGSDGEVVGEFASPCDRDGLRQLVPDGVCSASWDSQPMLRWQSLREFAAVLVALVAMVAAVVVAPAWAAFPGRNGLLLVRGSATPGCAPPTVGAPSGLPRCVPLGGGHEFHEESLFLADPTSGSVRLLAEGVEQEDTDPANGGFSPNGQLVALGSERGSGVYADPALDALVLFSVDPAVSPRPLGLSALAPSWSPDGRRLVYYYFNYFTGFPAPPSGMSTLTLAGRALRWIGRGWPWAWSSRNEIAYEGVTVNTRGDVRCGPYRRPLWTICTTHPDGHGATPTPLRGYNADWSPNGYRLVFWSYSRRRAAQRLMIGCPNGRGIRPLTTFIQGIRDSTAIWSPDGRMIAFDYHGDVYEIPSNPPHPLAPTSWHKIISNALLSDWQALPPAPATIRTARHVCQ